MGNGCYKNTVIHVILREEIAAGKIKRGKFDFLCAPPTAGHSLRPEEFWTDAPTLEENRVSCKKCLEICRKFQNSRENQ